MSERGIMNMRQYARRLTGKDKSIGFSGLEGFSPDRG
jgi:hypothetical protein